MPKNRICVLSIFAALMLAIVGAAVPARAQTFSVLYNFGTNRGDPIEPYYPSIVAQGRDGNLYTTARGGANFYGAVFKITPAGKLTVLYSFDNTHGADPFSGLTLAADGNFYGTTHDGGSAPYYGTVFKITPSGSLKVLHNFAGSDGAYPYAPPIQGTDGNFYGTTSAGGQGYGIVYKMTPSGNLTTLYQFPRDCSQGCGPIGPLVQATNGNFYGTAGGGTYGYGVVFRVTRTGVLSVLYNFDQGSTQDPNGPLVQGSNGSFYGTSNGGGSYAGSIWNITPNGAFTVLHALAGNGNEGFGPVAGLVQATDGEFYGTTFGGGTTTNGVIFRISSKGSFSVLHNFDGTGGGGPISTLGQHTSGVLYADTELGGTSTQCSGGGCGVFYSLKMGLGPFVSSMFNSGKVGRAVEILGQGFKGTTGVSFNGTAARFSLKSNTYLTATVPNGATTGFVTVKTPGGTLKSNKQFRVTPVILSFSPPSGPVGTPVMIVGTSFTGATKVTFGGVKATTFSVDSDTQVTATVPTGAKTGKIAITTPGGIAVSRDIFTVTP
jgi:uncharacterized repeat protein (TIGR03803 family)